MAATKNMIFDANLLPLTTGHNLGSSTNKWNIYVNTINDKSFDFNITDYLKWQTTEENSANLYDYGIYVNKNNAGSSGPDNYSYYSILNIPYDKPSGNLATNWTWSIGAKTRNDNRLFFRTSNTTTFGSWQEIAHAPVSASNIGSLTQPVYMTSDGVITAGTQLKTGAYYNVIGTGITAWSDTERLIPLIHTDGVIEIGHIIDFHVDTTAEDFDIRLKAYTGSNDSDKNLALVGNFIPNITSKWTLGNSSNSWKQIFIKNSAFANGDITVNRTTDNTTYTARIGFGGSNTNFGLYDGTNDNWIIYRNYLTGLTNLSALESDLTIKKSSPYVILNDENITRGVTTGTDYRNGIVFRSNASENKPLGQLNTLYRSDGVMTLELLTAAPDSTTTNNYSGIRLHHTSANVSRVSFDTTKLNTSGYWDSDIIINKETKTENAVLKVIGNSREIWLYSNNSNNSVARGIWLPSTGTGEGKSVFVADENNNITYNSGKVSGSLWIQPSNAASSIYFGGRNASGALYLWQSQNTNGAKGIYVASANDTTTSDDTALFEINQENQIKRWANYRFGPGGQYGTTFIYDGLDLTKDAHISPDSSTAYPTNWNLIDKNNNIVTRLEACIYPSSGNANTDNDGRVDTYWYLRNNFDGNNFDNLGIRMSIYADGTKKYTITESPLFKEALGLGKAEQNFGIGNYTAKTQQWGIYATVIDTNQTGKAFSGRQTALIIDDNGIWTYDATNSKLIWSIYLNNSNITAVTQNASGTVLTNRKILFKNNDSNTVGSIATPVFIDAQGEAQPCSYTFTNYLPLSGGAISGNLYPASNASYTLGTSTNAWKQIFIQNTNGSNGDITIKRGSSEFKIGYGSGNTNYGLYDSATSQWMIYSNGTTIILPTITTGAINATGNIVSTSGVWAGSTTASGDHEVYAASTIGRISMYSDGSKERGIWIYKDTPGKPNPAFAALKYNNNDNTLTIKCNQILATENDDGFFGYGVTTNGWNGITDDVSQAFGAASYKTYIRSNNNPLYHRRSTTTYIIPDGRNNYATNTRIWGITLPTNPNNTTNKNNTIELVVDNNYLFLWDNTNATTLWQMPPIVYSTTAPSSPTEGMIWLQPIS